MRDIKFRVWDKDRKRMHIVGEFHHDFLSIDEDNNIYYLNLQCMEASPHKGIDPEHCAYRLMRYTGLKDKNGKEIYEGDIVKYKVKGSDKTYTTVMKFNEEHGAFLFGIYEGVKMPCGKKTRMNKYTRKSVGSVEVIGNIYENPELLEGN